MEVCTRAFEYNRGDWVGRNAADPINVATVTCDLSGNLLHSAGLQRCTQNRDLKSLLTIDRALLSARHRCDIHIFGCSGLPCRAAHFGHDFRVVVGHTLIRVNRHEDREHQSPAHNDLLHINDDERKLRESLTEPSRYTGMVIAGEGDEQRLREQRSILGHKTRLARYPGAQCTTRQQKFAYAPHVHRSTGQSAMQPVIEMYSVGVRRGARWLLDNINWQVAAGSRWVILGPNGAGKTTLLNIAAAQLFPTRGEVCILSEQLGFVDVADLRTRIGWSSALLASELPPEETVHNVVLTGAYAVTGRWREDYDAADAMRAHRLVGEWGLAALADRPFGTLSEGERKRCMVARSLMADPELLILDEPAAGLDLAGREQLLDGLGRLAQNPSAPTMVLVTHHVEEIPPGFTDVLMLRDGSISAIGPLDHCLTGETLSDAFGMSVSLHRAGRRYFAVQQGT